ncbi:hypothetical protein CTI12_AA358300 [Artemisia annua]|uniref:Glycoside hydrolase family 3 N-terminal domain-containing protein n=1 Tax=Artemisia annua TaxID=35608 RepID=A0A2U1MQH2_ARTAN|nr:hypothetical protein CTI12_AA358300 [Artemisia annua]
MSTNSKKHTKTNHPLNNEFHRFKNTNANPLIHQPIDSTSLRKNIYSSGFFGVQLGMKMINRNSFFGAQEMDTELIKKIGAATALEVRATGIKFAFAPCVAVCRYPRQGRWFESFSEDSNTVSSNYREELEVLCIGCFGVCEWVGTITMPQVVRCIDTSNDSGSEDDEVASPK